MVLKVEYLSTASRKISDCSDLKLYLCEVQKDGQICIFEKKKKHVCVDKKCQITTIQFL